MGTVKKGLASCNERMTFSHMAQRKYARHLVQLYSDYVNVSCRCATCHWLQRNYRTTEKQWQHDLKEAIDRVPQSQQVRRDKPSPAISHLPVREKGNEGARLGRTFLRCICRCESINNSSKYASYLHSVNLSYGYIAKFTAAQCSKSVEVNRMGATIAGKYEIFW